MQGVRTTPVRVLLIEDNPADMELIQEAMTITRIPYTLDIIRDGMSAIAFLRGDDNCIDTCRPEFVLLDLILSDKSGLEVLKVVKSDTSLKQIPVAILTSTDVEEDVYEYYNLHVKCFLTKPWDLDQFITMMRRLEEFWFSTVTSPIVPHDE